VERLLVDDPQHPESYSNQLILNFYDWTPEPTAEAVASALSEERQGRRTSIFSSLPINRAARSLITSPPSRGKRELRESHERHSLGEVGGKH